MPTNIEWCDETINPLGHGCYGPGGTAEKPKICRYCYALTLAQRKLSRCELCRKFIPHTHFERLENGELPNWIIIGAETGNHKGKVIPKREWIDSIVNQCRAASVPVFMKGSLVDIWGEPLIQEWPEGLRWAD